MPKGENCATRTERLAQKINVELGKVIDSERNAIFLINRGFGLESKKYVVFGSRIFANAQEREQTLRSRLDVVKKASEQA